MILPVAVILFMLLGYVVLLGNLYLIMLLLIIYAFMGLAILVLVPALWEFWFPQPAKTMIVHKRAASWELAVDDIGWGELTPSRTYLPEGLLNWKFGWSLLPRPIQKMEIIQKILKKKPGRPPRDPVEAEKRQKEWMEKQKKNHQLEDLEREMAEQIALKKIMLKGLGKPLWLQYTGLASNFNPYVLVPLEAKQDNPKIYFQQFKTFIEGLGAIGTDVKEQLCEKLEDLQTRVEHIRVVIDPRRFKETNPKMYTPGQLDALGHKYFELGRLSVSGMPLGKILTVILIGVVVVVALFAFYYFFMRQPPPTP